MSSKVIRPACLGREDPQPIQWRAFGQPAPQSAGSTSLTVGTAEALPVDSERMEQLRAAAYQHAYQDGVAAAEATATERAQAQLEPVLASFSGIVNDLAGTHKKLRAEAEAAAVALAIEVARRVLHREIAADPEAILGVVKAAFQKCDARATQRLRVSPQDAEAIRENQSRLNFPPGLEILADRNLPPGSAIFETSRGDLDVSVDTQLQEIERGLTDVLRRRNP
jgi:flagellar assembly protein FliH